MKKQLMTIAILTLILSSCKKEDVSTPQMAKNKTEINPPPIVKRDPVTLPVVILHSSGTINFGWEYGTNDEGGSIMVYDIKTSVAPGGGVWTQVQSFWSNYPTNPNVINIVIIGAYVYYATTRFGVDKVTAEIIINVSYDVKSHVRTITVKSTGTNFVKK